MDSLPKTDVSFAPTQAFQDAFGREESQQQTRMFSAPTWAQNLRIEKGKEEEEEEQQQEEYNHKKPCGPCAEELYHMKMLAAGTLLLGIGIGFYLGKVI